VSSLRVLARTRSLYGADAQLMRRREFIAMLGGALFLSDSSTSVPQTAPTSFDSDKKLEGIATPQA
jgi:hypothetical protein